MINKYLLSFFISSSVLILLLFQNTYGQELKIDEITFIHKDTKTFEDKTLSSALGITESKKYDPEVLDDGISKLKKFYFDNGFFDTKIDTSLKYNLEDKTIIIQILIRENQRYKIDSLIYVGLERVSDEVLRKIYKIKTINKNDFYNRILIIQQSNEILDFLQNNGYMNARIKKDSGTIIKKYSSKQAITAIMNFEGADTIYYFGNTEINIKDNVYNVTEDIIRKQIVYNEGEIYSKEKKLNSEKNISKISIVQSARIEAQTINADRVNFITNVNLGKKNELTPYITGTSIENHFYIGGGIEYLNKYFLGGGKVLDLELNGLFNSIKLNRFDFSASVTQPHIINIKTTLTDKLTVGLYNLEDFKNYYLGNLTTLNYFISDHTFYNNASLSLNEELVRFHYDDSSKTDLNLFHSFLSTTFVHDNTNDVLSPTKGFYHSITIGNAGLLPKLFINAFKLNLSYSQFFKGYTNNKFYLNISSIIPSTIFATNFKLGDIIEYGKGDKLIPIQSIYKFFSGGSSSLRGWNPKSNGVLANKLEGGKFLLEGSFELRKKLFPDAENFLKNIGGAFFIDYGNVWETHKDFKFNQIALAIGFGVRYDLFLGPVRVDFGFKLYDPLDAQNEKWLFSNFSRIFKDKFAISFGIGQAF